MSKYLCNCAIYVPCGIMNKKVKNTCKILCVLMIYPHFDETSRIIRFVQRLLHFDRRKTKPGNITDSLVFVETFRCTRYKKYLVNVHIIMYDNKMKNEIDTGTISIIRKKRLIALNTVYPPYISFVHLCYVDYTFM